MVSTPIRVLVPKLRGNQAWAYVAGEVGKVTTPRRWRERVVHAPGRSSRLARHQAREEAASLARLESVLDAAVAHLTGPVYELASVKNTPPEGLPEGVEEALYEDGYRWRKPSTRRGKYGSVIQVKGFWFRRKVNT